MDGPFYHDLREPHFVNAAASVTLAATYKAIMPAAAYPPLGGNYFGRPGKKIWMRARGVMTTVLTPGNIQVAVLWGTGADANGVNVCQSAAVALAASQTNIAWELEFTLRCISIGAAGTVFGFGTFKANPLLIASTAQPLMIPASAPVVSAAIDLSAALIPSIQILRSGSTAETLIVHDFDFNPMN